MATTIGQFSQALATHCERHGQLVVPLVARATPLALAVCQIVAAYAQPSDVEFAARAFAGDYCYTLVFGVWRIGFSEGGVLTITLTSEGGHELIRIIIQSLVELDDPAALVCRDHPDDPNVANTIFSSRIANLLENRLYIDATNPLTIV